MEVKCHGISDHESVVLLFDEVSCFPRPKESDLLTKVVRPISADKKLIFCSHT